MSGPDEPSKNREQRARPAPRPSRSGGATPRTTPFVGAGGKVDPDALRRATAPAASAPAATGDDDTPATPAIPPDPDQALATGTPEDDAVNRIVFVLQRDLDKRLDRYLTDRIPFMSRTQLQRLIDEGGVTVNGRAPKASTRVGLSDRIEVFVPPPPSSEVPPEDIPLNVLYEDDRIIVLNKSPDIIVHPARSHLSGTLINALAFHFANRSSGALSTVGKEFARPGVVHRLDRHTSGLIVFAKDDEAHWRLAQQFERRTVDKRYLAIVHGIVEPEVDVIDLPLGPHPSREKGYREKYVVRHDALGKPSVTVARVRAWFGGGIAEPAAEEGRTPPMPRKFSLLELELKTGRTHQIRVHLSHQGWPIAGDDMYGGRVVREGDLASNEPGAPATGGPTHTTKEPVACAPGSSDAGTLIDRQALHAATLAFRHPATGEPMSFTAPLPADMARTVAALRRMDPSAAEMKPPGATVELGTLLS